MLLEAGGWFTRDPSGNAGRGAGRGRARIIEMLSVIRTLVRLGEAVVASVRGGLRAVIHTIEMVTRLPAGLGFFVLPVLAYFLFAFTLVYIYAPVRGYVGQIWASSSLGYAAERWLATAIYDTKGHFVGTFDPRMDSKQDVNYTGRPIELIAENYIASPDHKSIPVRAVPEHYWQCLKYHEDRHLGGLTNPFGIDLYGVLKIPYSAIRRTIDTGGPRVGVGGSTLPMQLVRAVYKLTPNSKEGVSGKLSRKLFEWWQAPVIYWALTKNGEEDLLRRWAADHLPLAQRTGGPPLYGVEQTGRVLFGKMARDLTIAEQYVLAAAVNHPIILLPGSKRLNLVRKRAWQRITLVRAKNCAVTLLGSGSQQITVIAELDKLANGPPDPRVASDVDDVLKIAAPRLANRARANPMLRANILAPAARYGVRREMEHIYGFGWREYVRGATLSVDVTNNLRFRTKLKARLKKLQRQYKSQIRSDMTLDPEDARRFDSQEMPDIVVAATNLKGEIVRYFESRDTAAYFGSWQAFDRQTGHYDPARESRAIASIGKMLAAIAIANQGRDNLDTPYLDTAAPAHGLESCRRTGALRRGRRAEVAFACSLSNPLARRLARIGQRTSRRLIDAFGFTMPPAPSPESATPPSTAIVKGLIMGSPRTVHRMSATVLAALTGQGHKALQLPSLVTHFDQNQPDGQNGANGRSTDTLVPNKIIRPAARTRLRNFLSAPLCYEHRGRKYGTLKSLSDWCAKRRRNVRLHFAKTGTHVNEDIDATIDAWVSGGIQFVDGRAYAYVVLVGTGNSNKPLARRLHASNIAAPLVRVLLNDLAKSGPPTQQAAVSRNAIQ